MRLKELYQYKVDVKIKNMTFREVFCIFLAQENGNVGIRLQYILTLKSLVANKYETW